MDAELRGLIHRLAHPVDDDDLAEAEAALHDRVRSRAPGAAEALNALCAVALPELYRFLLRHTRHEQDAADLAQDLFENVTKAFSRNEFHLAHGRASFYEYLHVAARRDLGRYAKRRAARDADRDESALAVIPAEQPAPDIAAGKLEAFGWLMQATRAIQRDVDLLFTAASSDMSNARLAHRFGLPVGSIDRHKHDAKRKVKNRFAALYVARTRLPGRAPSGAPACEQLGVLLAGWDATDPDGFTDEIFERVRHHLPHCVGCRTAFNDTVRTGPADLFTVTPLAPIPVALAAAWALRTDDDADPVVAASTSAAADAAAGAPAAQTTAGAVPPAAAPSRAGEAGASSGTPALQVGAGAAASTPAPAADGGARAGDVGAGGSAPTPASELGGGATAGPAATASAGATAGPAAAASAGATAGPAAASSAGATAGKADGDASTGKAGGGAPAGTPTEGAGVRATLPAPAVAELAAPAGAAGGAASAEAAGSIPLLDQIRSLPLRAVTWAGHAPVIGRAVDVVQQNPVVTGLIAAGIAATVAVVAFSPSPDADADVDAAPTVRVTAPVSPRPSLTGPTTGASANPSAGPSGGVTQVPGGGSSGGVPGTGEQGGNGEQGGGTVTGVAGTVAAWGYASTREHQYTSDIGTPVTLHTSWQWGTWKLATDPGVANRYATMIRTGEGRYTVRLPGIGSPNGVAHASIGMAWDLFQAVSCQLAGAAPDGADEVLDVACFDAAGTPKNLPFQVTFVRPSTGADPMVTTSHPGGAATYNSTGGAVRVQRQSTGVYQVDADGGALTGLGFPSVTARQATQAHCRPAAAARTASGLRLRIECSTRGAPVDSGWTLSYTERAGLPHDPSVPSAYLSTTGDPAGPVIDPQRSWSDNGETPSLRHTATGAYELIYPSLGNPRVYPGDVAVSTAIGAPGRYCRTGALNSYSRAGQVLIQVHCFDGAGKRADANFAVAYVRAPTGARV